MPSHLQFTPVFSQLQFMTSEVLCGGKFKHRFHWYSRESFNHLKYFNEVSSVASFLQTPESQTFKSFTVWQLGEARNHPCETMLHCLNQCFVFLVTRWPHWCTVFNMWAYQWFVQLGGQFNERLALLSAHLLWINICVCELRLAFYVVD